MGRRGWNTYKKVKRENEMFNNYKPLIKILIYVLDDNAIWLDSIKDAFDEAGISNYKLYTSGKTMISEFNEDVQIAIVDYYLNDAISGVDVVKQIRQLQPLCDCIFMSNQLDVDTVIDIVNMGGRTRFLRKDKEGFLERLVEHVQFAAIETDNKIRAALKSAARVNDTIKIFEEYKLKYAAS